jgi:hypothetical protein
MNRFNNSRSLYIPSCIIYYCAQDVKIVTSSAMLLVLLNVYFTSHEEFSCILGRAIVAREYGQLVVTVFH